MRIFIGIVAILLGVVGVLACLAVSGGAWWGSFALAKQVDELSVKAEDGLTKVDDALVNVNAKVATTTAAVEKVRTAANLVASKVQNDPATQSRLESLLDELTPQLDRAEALGDSLQALGIVLQNTADAVEQAGGGGTKLRSAADKLGSASATLGVARSRAESLRNMGAPPRAQDIVRLADQAKVPLERLSSGLGDVRKTTEDVRDGMKDVREGTKTWKIIVPAVITLLAFWVALGQLALIGWGRRRLTKPTPPPTPAKS